MHAENGWVKTRARCGAHAPYTFCRCSEFLSTLERCPLSRPLIGISTSVLSILPLPHLIVYGTRPLSGSTVISARGARNHKASSPLKTRVLLRAVTAFAKSVRRAYRVHAPMRLPMHNCARERHWDRHGYRS